MRKRTKWLAFALSVLFLLQSGIGSIFAVETSETTETTEMTEMTETTGAPVSPEMDDEAFEEALYEHYMNMEPLEGVETEHRVVMSTEIGGIEATLEGNIPDGVRITSAILDESEYPENYESFMDEDDTLLTAFDLTLFDGETEWQPEEGKTVVVALDAATYGLNEGDSFRVLHQHGDGEVEDLGRCYVMNGRLVFSTESFSSFVCIRDGGNASALTNYKNLQNPTYGNFRVFYFTKIDNEQFHLTGLGGQSFTVIENTTGTSLSNFGSLTEYSWGSELANNGRVVARIGDSQIVVWIMQKKSNFTLNAQDKVFYLLEGHTLYLYYSDGSYAEWNYTLGSGGGASDLSKYSDYSYAGYNFRVYFVNYLGLARAALYDSNFSGSYNSVKIRCYTTPQNGLPDLSSFTQNAAGNYVELASATTPSSWIKDSVCNSPAVTTYNYCTIGAWDWDTTNYPNGGSVDTGYIVGQRSTTGVNGYLQNLDFTSLRNTAANTSACYAYDGTVATSSNASNYVLIPYSVKFIPAGYEGWYIDCYLAPVCTLSYSVNAPGTPSPAISQPSSVTSIYEYGGSWESATVPAAPALNAQYTMTENGTAYTFLGWSTTQGGAVAYKPSASITISSNATLYGVWQQVTLTITYDLRLPGTPNPAITQTNYTAGTVNGQISTTAPTPTGLNSPHDMGGTYYNFLGWSTTAGGGVSYAPGASVTVSSNTTLYGVWERVLLNFNLTFHVSGVNLTLDPDQSFVFRLQGSANDGTEIDVPFVVCGNNTVVFAELPVGNYAVSVSAWAWRYGEWQWNGGAATDERSYTMGALNADTEFTFTAIRTDSLWLDDNAYVKAP